MLNPVILYRSTEGSTEEEDAAGKQFPLYYQRSDIPNNSLVLGRYSVLPFYQELVSDLSRVESQLINSYEQHQYIADLGLWVADLKELTPKTWMQGEFANLPEGKSFVLKGQTNSKKFLWDTHMFAKDKRKVVDVFSRLMDDSLIGTQIIYAREFVPLITYTYGLHDLPITKEFRFFILNKKILCGGFYWSSHVADIEHVPSVSEVPRCFMDQVIDRIGDKATFYVVDVAQAQDGHWLVTDINDGQMSGLSEVPPEELYARLAEHLVTI